MDLAELLVGSGLDHHEIRGGEFEIPIPGGQRKRTVLFASASSDSVVRIVAPLVRLPSRWGKPRGRPFILERLLQITRRASYAKAIALGPDAFALAADLPIAALTPRLMRGVILSLASLGDIKTDQLVKAGWWEESRVKALQVLDDYLRLDVDEARSGAIAVLRDASIEVDERDDQVMASIDHRDEFLVVFVEPVSSVVTLMVFPQWQMRAPIRGERYMVRLLELNRDASVAKAGIDADGDVVLIYQLPQLAPGLLPHAWDELARLLRAVENIDESGSWRQPSR